MPEGPSIIIAKEAMAAFIGKKVVAVSGTGTIDQSRLLHQKVVAIKSWGKHLLICCRGFTLRVHFLMFGSYTINEKKDRPEKLGLKFRNGEINLYACALTFLTDNLDEIYDWSSDVMSDAWDEKTAVSKLRQQKAALICDAMLNQQIFSGVGNIIKNEVLYRVRVHPESIIAKLPLAQCRRIVRECRTYSFEFLEWKRNFELKKHWLAHTKKTCLRCNLPFIKKYTGVQKRRSFFCNNCQKLYN